MANNRYYDYHILDIGDIVDEFVKRWDGIITAEIMSHPHGHGIVFPEVFTIKDDGTIHKQVYTAKHFSERAQPWHPDISIILATVLETIKAKNDTQYDLDLLMGSLWIDIAHMADIQIQSNVPDEFVPEAISSTRQQIASLSIDFGKKLYQRLIEFGLYKDGHFPYHYVGWQDNCAVVALDGHIPGVVKDIALTLE